MNKRTENNDNDENNALPFIKLAAVTANVIRYLETQNKNQNADRDADRAREKSDEEKAEDHRKYVDQRVREIAQFERRANGLKK